MFFVLFVLFVALCGQDLVALIVIFVAKQRFVAESPDSTTWL